MNTTSTQYVHLAPNPKSAYRQLFLKGTRIRARVLYGLFVNAEEPMTPEEIASAYGLPLEAVREAISYCQSQPPEIEVDRRREEAIMAAKGMLDPEYKFRGKPKLLSTEERAAEATVKLYLDDDMASPLLAKLLRQAGHDLQLPADVGNRGEDNPVHLGHAIQEQRVLLTGNHDDFENLHDLILLAGGHHPGILIVRSDNDPTRDLTPRGLVRAIHNLEAAGISLADGFQVLNHWR